MPSSLQEKDGSLLRHVSDEEAAVIPEGARPSDEAPTVISKAPPIVGSGVAQANAIVDLPRSPITPEAIVAGLRGRRLAHFELIEPIGVGGMAAVIRARDTQLDRFVALKILPPEMAQEPENIQRFHQEARAAAKLDHENIARVFFCGEDQGLHFIAFEFVEGINLRTMVERRGRIPVGEAIRYILQVAAGLEHATSRGVVHRDVKPSNIIVAPSGRAKLVDMGLARNMERRGNRDLTQSGVTLGTFDYISPEQALEPRDADARSDIYSLGCTLYHLLTGVAPVPDGTPAKKLHHHQHVKPIDPREFQANIPLELVQILGKMMEKDAKDRFQRPIEVVHHLMKIAQKVGAADGTPEGLLVLDAPVPDVPRTRPFLVIGLALMSLVAVVIVVSMATDPSTAVPLDLGNAASKGISPALNVKPDTGHGGTKPLANVSPGRPEVVRDSKQLQTVLGDSSASEIKALIEGGIDLTGEPLTIQSVENQRTIIESNDRDSPALLKFTYNGKGAAGLEVAGKDVVFRRIKFQLDSFNTPEKEAAAVIVRGAKSVTFQRCIFVQNVEAISPSRIPPASVLILAPERPGNTIPDVYFDECYFDYGISSRSGQVAVAINGPAVLHARNCAFKQHVALFHFRTGCKDSKVYLDHCASFVRGPVFKFSKGASALLNPRFSVFSNRESSDTGDFIYLDDEAGHVQYFGDTNLYHNLNNLVGRRQNPVQDEKGFQAFLSADNGNDVNSIYQPQSDAAKSPWQNQVSPEKSNKLTLAFQLKGEWYARKIGLERTWLGEAMDAPPTPLVAKETPREKIVDADDPNPAVYPTVQAALVAAKDGDIIAVKCGKDRIVKVKPVNLDQGSVTLKAHEGYKPKLVFDTNDKDSALFRLRGSSLKVEDMEILLDPNKATFESQSIAHLRDAAQCTFTRCLITLQATNGVKLNVATFVDLDLMMKPDKQSPTSARVAFLDCFVRGKGDLVALHGCRLLHVDVKNSLVALDGSLLDIQATNKEMALNQGVQWRMDHSSVYTTESVFALRSRGEKGLTMTEATIDNCLFASLVLDRPVVSLETERVESVDKYLRWKGEKNYFANFDKVIDWKFQVQDSSSDYGKLTFPNLSDELRPTLWDASPTWFRPADAELKSINGFGIPVDVEKRFLPPPPVPDAP